MAVYNLLEYSSNYSDKTVSLRFYSKDEANNLNGNIQNNNGFRSLGYKNKLLSDTFA